MLASLSPHLFDCQLFSAICFALIGRSPQPSPAARVAGLGALQSLVAAGKRLETQVKMGWDSAMNVCTDPHLLCDNVALFSSPATPEHAESRVSVLQSAVI